MANDTQTFTNKQLRRLKLGKLDTSAGTARQGGCPMGEVLLDGEYVGDWEPITQDYDRCSHSDRQETIGYGARFDYLGEDIDVDAMREGVRYLKHCWSYSSPTENDATSTKARLRRLILEAVLEAEAKRDANLKKADLPECRDCDGRVEEERRYQGDVCQTCSEKASDAHVARIRTMEKAAREKAEETPVKPAPIRYGEETWSTPTVPYSLKDAVERARAATRSLRNAGALTSADFNGKVVKVDTGVRAGWRASYRWAGLHWIRTGVPLVDALRSALTSSQARARGGRVEVSLPLKTDEDQKTLPHYRDLLLSHGLLPVDQAEAKDAEWKDWRYDEVHAALDWEKRFGRGALKVLLSMDPKTQTRRDYVSARTFAMDAKRKPKPSTREDDLAKIQRLLGEGEDPRFHAVLARLMDRAYQTSFRTDHHGGE